ncbi:uncharacterized protein LOC126984800 isoform X6 [Eriocheir sinensis]|uniref:uncharacterized protein LOC126984800 isoform X6 n=1 Tax=Eriocheir sinensis TaxID=95602 RepID=UPI0021C9257F|nr:uncharacterized protein LOC126984800 isoform X6 [Eriocheir sinensis]
MSGQDKQEQTAAGGRRKDKQDPDGDIIMRLEYGLLNSSSLELIERVKQFANLVLALMMLFARYNHWMVGDKFERLAPSLPRSYPPQPPKGRTEEQPPTPSLAAPHLLSSPPPPPPAPPLSTWTVEKGCLVWRCLIGKDKQDPDGDIIMRLEYGLLNSSSLELIERVKQFANLVLALMMLFARYNHWMVADKFERLAPSLVFFMLTCRLIAEYQIHRKKMDKAAAAAKKSPVAAAEGKDGGTAANSIAGGSTSTLVSSSSSSPSSSCSSQHGRSKEDV